MFLPFTVFAPVVKTNVSPSRWYQIGAAWGRPSARTVPSVAVLTLPSRKSRYSSPVISRAMRRLPSFWSGFYPRCAADRGPALCSAPEHAREQVLEEEALDELAAVSHADLLEGVLDVPLDRVLGDEDLGGNLAGGSPAGDEPDHLLCAGREAVGRHVEPGDVLGPRGLDDDDRLAGASVRGLGAGGVERDPAPRPAAHPLPREEVVILIGG